jgi:hypothetical protein
VIYSSYIRQCLYRYHWITKRAQEAQKQGTFSFCEAVSINC